jgi:hypothetical protein
VPIATLRRRTFACHTAAASPDRATPVAVAVALFDRTSVPPDTLRIVVTAGMPGPAIRIPGWIVPADALALLTVAELFVVSPVAVNVPASKTSRVERARTCLIWPLTTAATL